MSFKKNALIGNTIVTFITVIFVTILLAAFVFYSFAKKEFNSGESLKIDTVQIPYYFYSHYCLKKTLYCSGELEGKNITLADLLLGWQDYGAEKIKLFFEESKCFSSTLEILNEKDGTGFWCTKEKCFSGKADIFSPEFYKNTEKTFFIGNVKIRVIPLGVANGQ